MFSDFRRPRGSLVRFLPLITLECAGCIPEEQWLDDSSGFVYSYAKDDTMLEIGIVDPWLGTNLPKKHK